MKKVSGFSLFELLLTLSLVSLGLIMATPCLTHFLQQTKMTFVANKIVNELNLAKITAINKRQNICYGINENLDWSGRRYIQDEKGHCLYSFSALPRPFHLAFHNSLHQDQNLIFTPLGFTLSQRSSFYLTAYGLTTRIVINLSTIRVDPSPSPLPQVGEGIKVDTLSCKWERE
jgi:Tfp pilus assembly protein FimT